MADLQPGGRLQRGSGCAKGASRKGDSTGDYFLVSGKTTEKKTLRMDRDWLEEISRQASNVRLHAMLNFGFDGIGPMGGRVDWCAFEQETAKVLVAVVEAVLAGDHARAKALAELIGGG
jgi:hypothetical protein